MNTQKNLGNKCIHCLNDTSMGSGRFVNRYPAENDEFVGYCCDECEQNYYKDNPETESKLEKIKNICNINKRIDWISSTPDLSAEEEFQAIIDIIDAKENKELK